MVTVSALATTLFLGRWLAPWPLSLWEGANQGWWPLLWWLVKVQIFVFGFIWLRGTLPRLRYDQFMKFGWKAFIPVSIGWIMIVAAARALRNDVAIGNREILAGGAVIIVVLLLATWIVQARQDRKAAAREQAEADSAARPFDAASGGFPVPPLPGQEFTYTSRRSLAAATIVQDASLDPATTTQEDDHA